MTEIYDKDGAKELIQSLNLKSNEDIEFLLDLINNAMCMSWQLGREETVEEEKEEWEREHERSDWRRI